MIVAASSPYVEGRAGSDLRRFIVESGCERVAKESYPEKILEHAVFGQRARVIRLSAPAFTVVAEAVHAAVGVLVGYGVALVDEMNAEVRDLPVHCELRFW